MRTKSTIEQMSDEMLKFNIRSYMIESVMSRLYRKEPKLLISHEQFIENEYKKCRDNPYYFYNTYYMIGTMKATTNLSEEEFNKKCREVQDFIPHRRRPKRGSVIDAQIELEEERRKLVEHIEFTQLSQESLDKIRKQRPLINEMLRKKYSKKP